MQYFAGKSLGDQRSQRKVMQFWFVEMNYVSFGMSA